MIKCGESNWRANLRQIKAQKRRNTLCISSFCNEEMTNDLPSGAEGALISVYLKPKTNPKCFRAAVRIKPRINPKQSQNVSGPPRFARGTDPTHPSCKSVIANQCRNTGVAIRNSLRPASICTWYVTNMARGRDGLPRQCEHCLAMTSGEPWVPLSLLRLSRDAAGRVISVGPYGA